MGEAHIVDRLCGTAYGNHLDAPGEDSQADRAARDVFAAWGACRSCACTGYIQGGPGYQNCKNCLHHFSQHK